MNQTCGHGETDVLKNNRKKNERDAHTHTRTLIHSPTLLKINTLFFLLRRRCRRRRLFLPLLILSTIEKK